MNLDDLRAELDAHANDLDTRVNGRMAGIRAKIAQRRRRKAGATVAASVLAVGAIIGVPVVNQLSAGPEPAKQAPFPKKIDGDTKIASTMGDEGDTKVTLKFTPEDTDFLLKLECEGVPTGDASDVAPGEPWSVAYFVNGERGPTLCGPNGTGGYIGDVGGAATAGQVRAHWEDLGVRPGEPAEISIRIVDENLSEPSRERVDGARIGAAAYDMTGERIETDGVGLLKEKTVDGQTYELAGHDVGLADVTRARVDVPTLSEPALVTYGATDWAEGGKQRTALDGDDGLLTYRGGMHTAFLPDANAHSLRVSDGDGRTTADVVAAYYTRVDSDDEAPTFPDTIDGDSKFASTMGNKGDTKVTMTFTPEDTAFLLKVECDALDPVDDDVEARINASVLRVRVNRKWVYPACGRDVDSGVQDGFVGGIAPRDQIRDFWETGGIVEAGKPVTVTLQVAPELYGKARKKPIDGRIGVAVYDMTGDRVESGGAALPEQKTIDGETYELGGYDVADGSETTASIDVPALDTPAYVTHGATQGFLGSGGQVTVDGRRGAFTESNAILTEAMPDAEEHTLKIRSSAGTAPNSSVVLAYYTGADAEDTDTDESGLTFPETTDARDPLVASEVGDPGETELRATLTPKDTNLAIGAACTTSGPRGDIVVDLEVNGNPITSGSGCHGYDSEMYFADRSAANRSTWGEYDVEPGETSEVVVRARAKDGADLALDVRLGFAAYERSAPRTSVDGFRLDDCQRWDGRWYELAGYKAVEVTPNNREATLDGLDSGDDILVGVGSRGVGKGVIRLLADGKITGSRVAPSGGSFGYERVERPVDELAVRAGRKVDGGHLVVAYYVPENP